MEQTQKKLQLRQQVRAARMALSESERANAQQALTNRLLNLPAVKHAKTIGVYKAYGSEASLDDLVDALRASETSPKIAYPLVVSDTAMTFLRADADDDLAMFAQPKKRFSEYDQSKIIPAQNLDLLLIPGVAFDEKCNRLGQGGGYYDRYLPLLRPDCLTVGIAFDEQIVDEIPTGPYDHKVDYVVTPTQIFAA